MSAHLPPLVDSARAVVALGVSQGEIDQLDDASLVAGMELVREHERLLQSHKLWLSTAITRRSSHEHGYSGLARRNGAPTPAVFIQTLTGLSTNDATKLARLGSMIIDAETAPQSGSSPIADAVVAGEISVDCADAIRRGLGIADDAVTDAQLKDAAASLVERAKGRSPEGLLRMARQTRNELDLAAIERGEKRRSDLRYLRYYRRDGMCGGSWSLPDEDGGLEIHQSLQLLLASRTGGPRFVDETTGMTDDSRAAALEDTRTNEQVVVDGFAQLFHNGIAADPRVIPGSQRAAVRVIVTEQGLASGEGGALLEGSLTAITVSKLGEYLCEGGTVGVVVNDDGEVLDVGREQRLFTARQRTALAVRDGGCRYPDCEKPPAWCEAHHVAFWARDGGATDLTNGILLCRYHHMLLHTNGWEVIRDRGTYWLKPPPTIDPEQTLIEMPSKNPLVAAMKHARAAS